jgi:predicted ATP-binding protein involved in virulence
VFVGGNGCGKTSILESLLSVIYFIHQVYNNKSFYDYETFNLDQILYKYDKYDFPFFKKSNYIKIKFQIDDVIVSYSYFYDKYDMFNFRSEDGMPKVILNNFKDNIKYKPVIVRYSSYRFIEQNQKLLQLGYSFYNPNEELYGIIDPYIHYKNILAWFNDKNNKEAIYVRDNRDLTFRLPELQLLRSALSTMLLSEYGQPNFNNDFQEMTLTKTGSDVPTPVSGLSQGFQSVFLLVMDLTLRMIMVNPDADFGEGTVLNTPAIVLIDEIDLHLHPAWQQQILPTLLNTFPQTQFIVTTHSPQVLTSVKPENIVVLDGKSATYISSSTYGMTSEVLLQDIFNVDPRPSNEVKSYLTKYFELINDNQGKSEEAVKIRQILNKWIADDQALVTADFLMRRKELAENMRNAQNRTSS